MGQWLEQTLLNDSCRPSSWVRVSVELFFLLLHVLQNIVTWRLWDRYWKPRYHHILITTRRGKIYFNFVSHIQVREILLALTLIDCCIFRGRTSFLSVKILFDAPVEELKIPYQLIDRTIPKWKEILENIQRLRLAGPLVYFLC